MSNNRITPFVKRMRVNGGTIYTFSSAVEDIGLNINERNNVVKISNFALLDIPAIQDNNFESDLNQNKFNIRTIAGALEYSDEASVKDGRVLIAESFQNYALNLESNLLNQADYNPALTRTVSERVFWKWLKESGSIRWQKDVSANGTQYWSEEIDADGDAGYNSVVKYIGKVSAGNVRTDSFGTYNETYILVPTSHGQTDAYFKIVEDDNYKHNMKIEDLGENILGREGYTETHPDALSYLAQYDFIDSSTSVNSGNWDLSYDYDGSGSFTPGWWYTEEGRNSIDPNAYLTDTDSYISSGSLNTNLKAVNGLDAIYTKRSKVDCLSLIFEDSELKTVYDDTALTYDTMAIDYAVNDSYDFNTALIYYTVYNSAMDEILGTNLLGVLFLDAPNGTSAQIPGDGIVIPSLEKIQSGSTGFGTSYSLRLNIKTDNMMDDTQAITIDKSTSDQLDVESWSEAFANLGTAVNILTQNNSTIQYLSDQYTSISDSQTQIINDVQALTWKLNNVYASSTGTEGTIALYGDDESPLIDSSIYMKDGKIGLFTSEPSGDIDLAKDTIVRNLFPATTSLYDLGSTEKVYKRAYIGELIVDSIPGFGGDFVDKVTAQDIGGIKTFEDTTIFEEGLYTSAQASLKIGYQAAENNIELTNRWTAIGNKAGQDGVTNSDWTAIGYSAGPNATGSDWTAIGAGTAYSNNSGNNWTAVGMYAGGSGSDFVAIGKSSGENSSGDNFVAIGNVSGTNNDADGWIAIGQNAGRYIYDATTPISDAADSLYIGRDTRSGGGSVINENVIGYNALGNGSNSFTFGNTDVANNYFWGNLDITGDFKINGVTLNLDPSISTLQEVTLAGSTTNQFVTFTGGVGSSTSTNTNYGYLAQSKHIGEDSFATAIGFAAAENNTSGTNWTAVGATAGYKSTTGNYWTAVGDHAGMENLIGQRWTAIGSYAGTANVTSNWVAVGYNSGKSNTSGTGWTAIGYDAAESNIDGWGWTALGADAGGLNSSGGYWNALGYEAGYNNAIGEAWTAIGYKSGFSNTSDSNWISIGNQSSAYLVGGTTPATSFMNSLYIGNLTKVSANGVINENVIGYNGEGKGSNTFSFGNSSITDNYFFGNLDITGGFKVNGVPIELGSGTVTSIATSGPITGGGITTSGTIGITQATISTAGYLSSSDWNTFNNKISSISTSTATATGPLNISGTDNVLSATALTIDQASINNDGYLSSADFSLFWNYQFVSYYEKDVAISINSQIEIMPDDLDIDATQASPGFYISNTGKSGTDISNMIWKETVGVDDLLKWTVYDKLNGSTTATYTDAITFSKAGDIDITGDFKVNGVAIASGYGSLQETTDVGSTTETFSSFYGGICTSTGNTLKIGNNAAKLNTTGNNWIAIGDDAATSSVSGSNFVAIGNDANIFGTDAHGFVAIGSSAGRNSQNDSWVAIGDLAAQSNIDGYGWVAIGYNAGSQLVGGAQATAIYWSTYIGQDTKASANGVSNEIVIGYKAEGKGTGTVVIGTDDTHHNYFFGNVDSSTAPTIGSHLTNKTYVDSKIDAKGPLIKAERTFTSAELLAGTTSIDIVAAQANIAYVVDEVMVARIGTWTSGYTGATTTYLGVDGALGTSLYWIAPATILANPISAAYPALFSLEQSGGGSRYLHLDKSINYTSGALTGGSGGELKVIVYYREVTL